MEGIFLSFCDGYALIALGYGSILQMKPSKRRVRRCTRLDQVWLCQHLDRPVLPRRLVPDAHRGVVPANHQRLLQVPPHVPIRSSSRSFCFSDDLFPGGGRSFGGILESASYSTYASLTLTLFSSEVT